ncbi:MAG: DUF3375 family protein [Polaromonas sp.]|nr:DUF3375 family protein [Polaromonas sp.]
MNLDYTTLDTLRRQHPAWRLLAAEHAVLVASFLHHVFIAPNVRVMAQADLAEALEDTLFGLRERLGEQAFPKSAQDYSMTGRPMTRAGCASFTPRAPTSRILI